MISWAVIYGEFRGLLGRRAYFWEQCQGRQRTPTPSHSWLATLPVPLLKATLSARERGTLTQHTCLYQTPFPDDVISLGLQAPP